LRNTKILNKTNKITNIFLSSKSKFDTNDNVNIILSPEFYWTRIFEINIKSKKEITTILPTLFEEFTYIDELKFYYKHIEDNQYLCFAYDETKIIQALTNANLSTKQIEAIYFGQIELESIIDKNNPCVKVDGTCLSFIDNLLVQIPCILNANIENKISIDNIELSKHKININSTSKYIDSKIANKLSVLLIILIIINFSKVYINMDNSSKIDNNLDKIKTENNMPATSIQTKSIIQSLSKKSKQQLKMRTAIKYIFNIKNISKSKIVKLELKDNTITCKFLNANNKNKIENYISKKYKIVKNKIYNKELTIGFKI
jgi:hypothetical protein